MSPQARETHHFRRMIAIWVVLAVALDLVFYFAVGPHVPPGDMTSSASGAQFDFNVLFMIAFPVMLAVWVYMGLRAHRVAGSRGGDGGARGGGRRRGATSASRSAGSPPPR